MGGADAQRRVNPGARPLADPNAGYDLGELPRVIAIRVECHDRAAIFAEPRNVLIDKRHH